MDFQLQLQHIKRLKVNTLKLTMRKKLDKMKIDDFSWTVAGKLPSPNLEDLVHKDTAPRIYLP